MKTSTHSKQVLIGALAAVLIAGASAGTVLAQARTSAPMSSCLSPQASMQNQQCDTQRQPFYQSDDRIVPKPDNRLQMNMDNGGGGTQMPVVPNTTGAPVMTGGANGLGF